MADKRYTPMNMSDGTTMISVGSVHVRVPKDISDQLCGAMMEAYREGQRDSKATLRTALGVDHALDMFESQIYHDLGR